jgi:hypothetical protein
MTLVINAELACFQCIEMAVFDASTLSGTYQAMNTATQQADTGSTGFQAPIKILKVYNDGSTGVTFSFDGVVKHDYLPSKGTMIIDLQTNHSDGSTSGTGTLNGRQGQLVYGKGTASSAGLNIYISGYR